MKKWLIILALLFIFWVFAQKLFRERIPVSPNREAEKTGNFVFYKNATGGISKFPLPISTGTGDGNLYLTGDANRVIYGIGKNVSWEIEYYEDPLDVVKDFSEVIPPDDWVLNPTGHKLTLKLYSIFQALEQWDEWYATMKKNVDWDTFEIYNHFRAPNESSLWACLANPYEDNSIETITNTTVKAMCKDKVPKDLTFDVHDIDQRYKRFRISLFYTAYKEKNASVCEPLLVTRFPKDKNDDIYASHFINYQLCQTLAIGDPYTKTQVPTSEAIRRMGYRINASVLYNKCSLYSDIRLQKLCEELRKIHLIAVKGNG